MNDSEICRNVIEELEFEPRIDAVNIGVTVEKSVVTLSGHVSDYAQKVAAERAAWRVKGVKAIAQEIQVRLPGHKMLNDDEIAQRAVNILAWSVWVPDDAIRVKVANGWVTLSGQVEWNYMRSAAESEIRKLSGVMGVSNEITLTPAAQSANIKQHILDALKRHAEIEGSGIRIDIQQSGTVKIEGEVDDWDERRAVERAVWATPGVISVEDHLRIR